MARASRAWGRAALLVVLAGALQSSTCHAHYCSGDGCHDDEEDEEEEGGRTEMLVLPPLRDPFGRPLTSPIPLCVSSRS